MKTNTATCAQPLFVGKPGEVQRTGGAGGQELACRWSTCGQTGFQSRAARPGPLKLPRDQLSNSPDWLELQASGRPLGTTQRLRHKPRPGGEQRPPFLGQLSPALFTLTPPPLPQSSSGQPLAQRPPDEAPIWRLDQSSRGCRLWVRKPTGLG